MRLIPDLLRLLWAGPPESEVPWRWLLRRPSIVDGAYRRRAAVKIEQRGRFQHITVNDEVFVWPARASVEALLQITSEIQTSNHPNQYLWGPTLIRPGDVVFDIGACEGSFAARAAELGAAVIAVEPSQYMSEVMRQLFESRQLPALSIANCLLGSSRGQLHFADNFENPGKSRLAEVQTSDSYAVDVLTLDGLIESRGISRVDFIKCDAEGADVDIIKSGINSLRRFHPKLAICTYHADDHFTELHSFLTNLGYRVKGKGFLHAPGKFRVVMLHAWYP